MGVCDDFTKKDRFYPGSKTCSRCGHVLEELDLKDGTSGG
jgi:transposase